MPPTRVLGIIFLVAGLVVLFFAYQSSQSVADQTKDLFTGNFRDKTNWLILAGAASSALGFIAVLVPGRALERT